MKSLETLNKIKTRKKVVVNIVEKFFTNVVHVETNTLNFDAVCVYDVYAGQLGAGTKQIFIRVNPSFKMKLGESSLCLRKLTRDEHEEVLETIRIKDWNLFKKIMAMYGIKLKDNTLWHDMEGEVFDKGPIFFDVEDEVDITQLFDLSNEELENLVIEYVIGGMERYDELLANIFASGIFTADFSIISPEHYQKYNAHKVIFTNPSTGKTTMGKRIGIDIDEASKFFLKGGGSIEKSVEGRLHKEVQDVFLEEIQDLKDEDIYTGLNLLEEQGEAEIGKGLGTLTRTMSALNYIGNVKNVESANPLFLQEELLSKFSELLTIITNNQEAFGKRKALTLFGTDFVTVQGRGYNVNDLEKLGAVFRTLQRHLARKYTYLFLHNEIQEWLNTPFDAVYSAYIVELAKRVNTPNIKQFIRGNTEAYRHQKGLALKLALMERIKNLLQDDLKLVDIVDMGKEKEAFLQNLQIKSFEMIVSRLENQDMQDKLVELNYKRLPLHTMILVDSVIKYINEKLKQRDKGKDILLLREEIEEDIREVINRENQEKQLQFSYNTVWNRLLKNVSITNTQLHFFGLTLLKIDENAIKLLIQKNTPLILSVPILSTLSKSLSDQQASDTSSTLDKVDTIDTQEIVKICEFEKVDIVDKLREFIIGERIVSVQNVYEKFGRETREQLQKWIDDGVVDIINGNLKWKGEQK